MTDRGKDDIMVLIDFYSNCKNYLIFTNNIVLRMHLMYTYLTIGDSNLITPYF